jgi:hypothetical protein
MNNAKNPLLSLVKIDVHGNKWFTFREPNEMPYLRSMVADISKRFHGAKITKESLTELLQEQKRAKTIEEKNKIADEILLRTNYLSDEGTLLELCSVYFILNDENPEVFDKEASKEKQRLLNEDYKLKCFFLFWLVDMIPIWQDISIFDIVEYLELPKELKDELARNCLLQKK